jgi:repressor LexA
VLEARRRQRQALLQRNSAWECQPGRMDGMDRPDRAVPRGSIVGLVWAGDPDDDPVIEETQVESLLDELNVGTRDYFLRVRGFSMKEAGIEEGDLVQIRPVRLGDSPPDGAIVLAEVDISQAVGERSGRTTIKRFFRQGAGSRLEPANSSLRSQNYEPDDLIVVGEVVNVIRQLSPS